MVAYLAQNTCIEPTIDEFEELPSKAAPRKYKLVYVNVIAFTYSYIAAMYGLYLGFTQAHWTTIFFNSVLIVLSGIGITAGAHRLWTHRSYKAKLPLQIILIILNSLAFQTTAIDWIRDHRLHHRYSDTDADPYNASRGFFFSHIGWALVKKHEEVKKRGKFIDMSDVYANPVLLFQKKYALPFIGTICFLLPTLIPVYCWGEKLNVAWHICILKYVLVLNCTFLVNSAAHLWGYKPYDKNLKPVQNKVVSFLTLGEGFHNYHHVYPWDYRTAELGNNKLNFTTSFIDLFAKIGWAYDLKTVPQEIIDSRAKRTGDGSDPWGRTKIQEINNNKEKLLRSGFTANVGFTTVDTHVTAKLFRCATCDLIGVVCVYGQQSTMNT